MRQINTHIVNPANDKLEISVLDEPGHGGACHHYVIEGADLRNNPSVKDLVNFEGDQLSTVILFQNGPIGEDGNGVNGITHEALLAILIDRLQGFQSGQYACTENEVALARLTQAQQVLQERTRKRMERGVEGTHTV